jgi:hypothetical protein
MTTTSLIELFVGLFIRKPRKKHHPNEGTGKRNRARNRSSRGFDCLALSVVLLAPSMGKIAP